MISAEIFRKIMELKELLMDKRLLTCAELCVGDRLADIGTDHGYLPCYMVKKGLCKTALACDVAVKPLESAKEHISQMGLEDSIEAVLSDGLDGIDGKGITDISIAGMGGELIADILSRAPWVKENRVNLILQPMTKWDFLRGWLYRNDFEVKKELPCREGRFVYSVMQAVYTGKKPEYECDLRYLYCGLVTADTPDGRAYLERQISRLETAGRGMSGSADKLELAKEMLATAGKLSAELGK